MASLDAILITRLGVLSKSTPLRILTSTLRHHGTISHVPSTLKIISGAQFFDKIMMEASSKMLTSIILKNRILQFLKLIDSILC